MDLEREHVLKSENASDASVQLARGTWSTWLEGTCMQTCAGGGLFPPAACTKHCGHPMCSWTPQCAWLSDQIGRSHPVARNSKRDTERFKQAQPAWPSPPKPECEKNYLSDNFKVIHSAQLGCLQSGWPVCRWGRQGCCSASWLTGL
eukprot:1137318-Pelagomonas_calceolata.AAC.4